MLNKYTIKEHFPYPDVHSKFVDLKNSFLLSKNDLAMGFHQICIKEKDIQKTVISVSECKYEFIRMPFELRNATLHFKE